MIILLWFPLIKIVVKAKRISFIEFLWFSNFIKFFFIKILSKITIQNYNSLIKQITSYY